ncbi:hypothetical protein [Pseudomonas sp. CHM02]|uniref:DUF6896 domain-containing protein n=1 Tax=Pseudomonas sp. CHM02 TaxID=1463662 RepID=UPI00210AF10F|nr:hypothetical protein [Pseudomonas sp. CHM02]
MQTHTLETLILEYLGQVNKTTELLEQPFGTKKILGLWNSKKIPQRSAVTDMTYELHSIGCHVYLSDRCIDFDCDPDDRVDGFNLWRLYIYACELARKHKKYTDKEYLTHEFNDYLKLGKAKKIPGAMSNLYFIQRLTMAAHPEEQSAPHPHATTNNPTPNTKHNGE